MLYTFSVKRIGHTLVMETASVSFKFTHSVRINGEMLEFR
uniref:Uncharacterized protein n=1 Tax=Arundo donax TaxID=35708 RepID=A0A0A8ZQ22_ARUDO